jgi:beta-lactamase regulating signal transducer with metallopeptidase domain
MEALFLKILNMSITASYVILAIIFIRFLIKMAPKKYAYLLWSVVLFRLVCPVSFSAVFSIFQSKPFDTTIAQAGGGATLNYIPTDIVYMEIPKVTVGIPTMNSMISESLPAAAPYASVNPMQIWMLLGTILWCAGIAALLVYSIVTYTRLQGRMSTAVRLEDNVFESDKIRSPFILGFIRPKIYIPFGLGEAEQGYILQHEKFHLQRRDYLIKLIGFCVLTIHWFNPLVWLAFILMSKDMEMSCDEKILSTTGSHIAHDYSTSLLAFAMNRRLPAASPLAFGESGIRERVENVLRFKKPKKWVVSLSAMLCIAAIITCAANPMSKVTAKPGDLPYGHYVFAKQIYMNPLSSFMAFNGFTEYYTLMEDMLIITDATGIQRKVAIASWKQDQVDDQAFKKSFMINHFGVPDISKYKQKKQYTLTGTSESRIYRIYRLDDEIWLAQIHKNVNSTMQKEYFWSIYKIKSYDGEIPMQAEISGTQDGVADFITLLQNFKSGSDTDTCYNITPDYIRDNSGYSVFKYDASCASFLLYEGKVYPLGEWFGGLGVTNMTLADLNGDQKPELYFTYSWGSGLHRSHVAYFDPVGKKVVTLDYTHLNKDMLITENEAGGLSLYEAAINRMESFVNFTMERTDYITDIVYKNGQISLIPVSSK